MLVKLSRTPVKPSRTPPIKATPGMIKGRIPLRACGPFLLGLALALAACGDRSVPSAAENAQLDNAANMLDEAENALEGIDANALGPVDENVSR